MVIMTMSSTRTMTCILLAVIRHKVNAKEILLNTEEPRVMAWLTKKACLIP